MSQETAVNFDELDANAKSIINTHVAAAAGVGLVPIPLIDLVGLTGVQLNMLRSLSNNYGVEFKQEIGKSAIASLIGGIGAMSFVPTAASLLKAIPLIGYTTSALTISITGAATTYAIGCVFGQHFASGGNMLNFNPAGARAYFAEKFEEGKIVAGNQKNKG